MNRIPLLLTIAAAAALAGCNKESHTIVAGGHDDTMANDMANAPPVELPPAIEASKSYRCKDNSVVYLDWLADKTSANYRATKDGAPTKLSAAEAGKPLTADGYSLTGNAKAATITLERPGKGSQSCKG